MNTQRFWRWRFPLAAALAALALLVGVSVFVPKTKGVSALVVRQAVCAGCVIPDSALQVKTVSASALPQDYLKTSREASGRTASVALSPGTVMQEGFTVETGVRDLKTGEVAFTLETTNPEVMGLSHSGLRVEIWADGESGVTESQILATDVRVVGVQLPEEGFLSTSAGAATVYLAASEEEARKVISAKSQHQLSFVLRGAGLDSL